MMKQEYYFNIYDGNIQGSPYSKGQLCEEWNKNYKLIYRIHVKIKPKSLIDRLREYSNYSDNRFDGY